VRLVTRYTAGVQEAVVAPDGEQIAYRSAYQGQPDLYLIRWDGSDERRLTTGGASPENLRWSKDGKTVYYLSRGRLQRIAASGGSPQTTRTDAEIVINLPREREYLYDAAWRTLNETFYDPNFHGVNWAAMRDKYRPYLPYAQTDRDFTAVVLMMLGELRSSHLSFSLARGESTDAPSNTGMLGVIFSDARDGDGLLIERVLPNTPAARREVNLKPGERILAVNGKPLTRATNLYQLLDNTVGKRIANSRCAAWTATSVWSTCAPSRSPSSTTLSIATGWSAIGGMWRRARTGASAMCIFRRWARRACASSNATCTPSPTAKTR
jgi:tricorn protease